MYKDTKEKSFVSNQLEDYQKFELEMEPRELGNDEIVIDMSQEGGGDTINSQEDSMQDYALARN